MAWRAAQRAYDRRSHQTKAMLSMDSLSPLKSWYCPDCSRYGSAIIEYSVTTLPPLCGGGRDFL